MTKITDLPYEILLNIFERPDYGEHKGIEELDGHDIDGHHIMIDRIYEGWGYRDEIFRYSTVVLGWHDLCSNTHRLSNLLQNYEDMHDAERRLIAEYVTYDITLISALKVCQGWNRLILDMLYNDQKKHTFQWNWDKMQNIAEVEYYVLDSPHSAHCWTRGCGRCEAEDREYWRAQHS